MTKIIAVASGKGGVGKTTLVANLGIALAELGKDTIVLDGNLTTPNLGLHLGVPLYPYTIHDVLKNTASVNQAIYEHESGLKIIPAGIALKDLNGVDMRNLSSAIMSLIGKTDIIIIDASAGLGREALSSMESADELLIITNPDMPSVTDALKTVKLAEQMGTKVGGLIVNRVSGKKHQMTGWEIHRMVGADIIAEIPEDEAVHKAISERTPVVKHSPNSKASRAIKKLAHEIAGYEYRENRSFFQRLLNR